MDKKKKIRKANERKGKVKRGKCEEVNGQGGKEVCPSPTWGTAVNNLMHNVIRQQQNLGTTTTTK